MRAVLVLALLSLPMTAGAQPRRERSQPTMSQCFSYGRGATYVAPRGSASPELCTALIRRCANDAGRAGTVSDIPQRISPPYFVCG